MTEAKARIWARLIYKGQKTLNDVPKDGRQAVKDAYYDIYGEELEV